MSAGGQQRQLADLGADQLADHQVVGVEPGRHPQQARGVQRGRQIHPAAARVRRGGADGDHPAIGRIAVPSAPSAAETAPGSPVTSTFRRAATTPDSSVSASRPPGGSRSRSSRSTSVGRRMAATTPRARPAGTPRSCGCRRAVGRRRPGCPGPGAETPCSPAARAHRPRRWDHRDRRRAGSAPTRDRPGRRRAR